MKTTEQNLEPALRMIDRLAIEIKRHERNSKLEIRLADKVEEKRMANHKRGLINKIRLSIFDIEDGVKTLDEVLKS